MLRSGCLGPGERPSSGRSLRCVSWVHHLSSASLAMESARGAARSVHPARFGADEKRPRVLAAIHRAAAPRAGFRTSTGAASLAQIGLQRLEEGRSRNHRAGECRTCGANGFIGWPHSPFQRRGVHAGQAQPRLDLPRASRRSGREIFSLWGNRPPSRIDYRNQWFSGKRRSRPAGERRRLTRDRLSMPAFMS